MKIKHLFVLITSLLLPACGGKTTNSPSESENESLNNAEVEFSEDVTPNINMENKEINYAVSDDDRTTRLVTEIEDQIDTPPSQEYDDKNDAIASFSTKVYTKTQDRMKNLQIVCDKLSGTVLAPGQEFSYNDTCGPYNKENGFGKATVFIDGEEVQEYGGGVCQLSSTLYNAIRNLNVDILERHNHSKEVYYVPKNEDATVSFGSLDFRFKNNENYPIEIEANSNENEVTVSIFKI